MEKPKKPIEEYTFAYPRVWKAPGPQISPTYLKVRLYHHPSPAPLGAKFVEFGVLLNMPSCRNRTKLAGCRIESGIRQHEEMISKGHYFWLTGLTFGAFYTMGRTGLVGDGPRAKFARQAVETRPPGLRDTTHEQTKSARGPNVRPDGAARAAVGRVGRRSVGRVFVWLSFLLFG